jgi:hypothetical protein
VTVLQMAAATEAVGYRFAALDQRGSVRDLQFWNRRAAGVLPIESGHCKHDQSKCD